MKKPEGLRRLLLAAVPALKATPESVAMHVDAGRIGARQGATLSFEYRYTLTLVFQEYAGEIDALVVPILAWIAEAEPDLLKRPDDQPFAFEAEILDGDMADIQIQLELTEKVRVTPRAGGGFDAVHADLAPPDADRFPGVCALLLEGYWRDELVAQSASVTPAP